MKKTKSVKPPEGWEPMVDRPDEFVPFSRDHIDIMVERGQFPAPIPIGPKKRAWLARELVEWQQRLIRARDNA